MPQALCGRETLNRLGKAALAVIDAPLEWAPVRWIAENIGVQLLLMLLVALWALRRRGVDGLALALPVALAVFSLYAGYVYNPAWPYERMALLLLSIALSGRFEIWHNVFWSAPLSLLGGLPTDGDEHHAIDNTFLAVPMNKGLLGAILVAAVFLLLLWRLAKKHRSTEVICLVALTLYLFMENKPFLLSANPFLLMLPVVFFNAETGKAQSES